MQTNIKEYDESFDLTQALQKKGTKEYGFIHLAQRANGSWVNIPIMLAVGAQDGPTLVVDACNHGDEYEGTEGIIKTFEAGCIQDEGKLHWNPCPECRGLCRNEAL